MYLSLKQGFAYVPKDRYWVQQALQNSTFYDRDLLEQTENQVLMENVAEKVSQEFKDYRDIQDNKADLVNQEILDQKETEEHQARKDHMGQLDKLVPQVIRDSEVLLEGKELKVD